MALTMFKVLWMLLLIQLTGAQLPGLPPGVEIVNPKDLGLSESDLERFLGRVKVLNTGNGNKNTQVVSVGFDENERINLEDFKELQMDGLGREERIATQQALNGLQNQYSGNIQQQDINGLQNQYSGNIQPQQNYIPNPSPPPPPVIMLPQAPPIQQPNTYHTNPTNPNLNTQVEVFNSHSRDITQHEANQILGDVQQQGPIQFVQESSMVIPHPQQGGPRPQIRSSTPQPFIFQYQPSPQPNTVQNQQQFSTATPAPPMQIMISSTPTPQPQIQYQQAPLVQQYSGPFQVAQPVAYPPSMQPQIIMVSSTAQPQPAPAISSPQPQGQRQLYMIPPGQQVQINHQNGQYQSPNPQFQQVYVSQPMPQPPVQQYYIEQPQPAIEPPPQYFGILPQPQYFAPPQPQQQFYFAPQQMPEFQFQQLEQPQQQIQIQETPIREPERPIQKAVVEEMHVPEQKPQISPVEEEQPDDRPLKVQFSHAYDLESQNQNTQEDEDDESKFRFPQKQYSSTPSPTKSNPTEFKSVEKNKPPHYVPPHSLFFTGLDDDGTPKAPTIQHGPLKPNFKINEYVTHNDIEEDQVRRPPSFSPYNSRPRPRIPFSSTGTSKYGRPVSNADLIKFFSNIIPSSSTTPRYYSSSKNYRDTDTPYFERASEPSFKFPSYSRSEPHYSRSEPDVIYPTSARPYVPFDVTPSSPMERISEPQNAIKSDRWSGGTGRGFRSYTDDYDSASAASSTSRSVRGFRSPNTNFEPITSGSEQHSSYFKPSTRENERHFSYFSPIPTRSEQDYSQFRPIPSGSEQHSSYFRPISRENGHHFSNLTPIPSGSEHSSHFRPITSNNWNIRRSSYGRSNNNESEDDARIRMYYELIQNKFRNTFKRRFLG